MKLFRVVFVFVFAVMLLAFFVSVPVVHAQTVVPLLTLSQVVKLAPADCVGSGCEGQKPPPLGPGCANSQPFVTEQIDTGSTVFNLYLYGGNCGAFWAAAYYSCSAACSGAYTTITALGVWERNSLGNSCDTSNAGALDSMPVTLNNSHHWESTYMIASRDNGCGGSAFHAAMYASDLPGGPQHLYNSGEWFQ